MIVAYGIRTCTTTLTKVYIAAGLIQACMYLLFMACELPATGSDMATGLHKARWPVYGSLKCATNLL